MLTPSTDTDSGLQTQPELEKENISSSSNLMLFELSWSGHHAGYILHLIRYWSKHKLSGSFNIVVAPEFIERHSDVVEVALNCSRKNVHFVAITTEESQSLLPEDSFRNRSFRAFQSLNLIRKYAVQLKASQCLITYFDSLQLSLATGLRLPCIVSGIYFRPTFHYSAFADYYPSLKERLQQFRERIFLSRALNHPQFKTLFCLDPFVVNHIHQINRNVKAVYLPDPVQEYVTHEHQLERLRSELGILPERLVFLLFGRLEGRKGIHQLLQAVLTLPPSLCEKLCLLLVGPIDVNEKRLIESKIAEVSQLLPVQIITSDQFVPDHEIQPYFQIADVILAPYQRHIGMSAILIRAATAQKPVLASDYGLMGELTRLHHLGLVIDSTSSAEIAKGLTQLLSGSPEQFCSRDHMRAFGEMNSAKRYASTIFENL